MFKISAAASLAAVAFGQLDPQLAYDYPLRDDQMRLRADRVIALLDIDGDGVATHAEKVERIDAAVEAGLMKKGWARKLRDRHTNENGEEKSVCEFFDACLQAVKDGNLSREQMDKDIK